MSKIFFNRKGQSTAEYAILIGLVIAAAIGMQTFVKRGVNARIREGVNDSVGQIITGDYNLGLTSITNDLQAQFDPDGRMSRNTEVVANVAGHGTTNRFDVSGTSARASTVQSSAAVDDYQEYDWGWRVATP